MKLGYARVSTRDQDTASQRAELTAAGCERIYSESISGARRDRPELERLLDHVRTGDVVVVTRLDRLARSTQDLLSIAEQLLRLGVGMVSLAEPWADTTTPAGKMVMTVFAGIAEFERTLIIDRTRAGQARARAAGKRFGRPPRLSESQMAHARELIAGGRSVPEAAEILGVHRTTLYKRLAKTDPR